MQSFGPKFYVILLTIIQAVKPLHAFIHPSTRGYHHGSMNYHKSFTPKVVDGRRSTSSSCQAIKEKKGSKPERQPVLRVEPKPPKLAKLHSMAVCMVPKSKDATVWEAITRARTELRDPGLYRWPPHANILYPFLDIQPKNPTSDAVDAGKMSDAVVDAVKLNLLSDAVKKCEPFRVVVDSFGTFGGRNRGVLYLEPRSSACCGSSSPDNVVDQRGDDNSVQPLIQLQALLQEVFPECPDQVRSGTFTPHMTLSHFSSLQDALEGQKKLETWWKPLEFDVEEIYVLKRVGDDGQFKILATLPLGNHGGASMVQVYDPLLAFPGMPLEEEDWVREERMQLKVKGRKTEHPATERAERAAEKKERVA